EDAGEHFDGGGLPGAVRAEQREQFAGRHLEGDVADGLLRDSFGLDQGLERARQTGAAHSGVKGPGQSPDVDAAAHRDAFRVSAISHTVATSEAADRAVSSQGTAWIPDASMPTPSSGGAATPPIIEAAITQAPALFAWGRARLSHGRP